MLAELLHPQDPRWQHFLETTLHDTYHLPQYVELFAHHEAGIPCAFYAEDHGNVFLAPLIIRNIPSSLGAPDGWCDAVSPYGYSTPLLQHLDDANGLRKFLTAFREWGADYGLVTAFFRLHPLYELPQGAFGEFGELVSQGETVVVDLALSLEELWSQTRRDHRKDINKLVEMGFTVVMDDWSSFDLFVRTYTETMRRLAAEDFYFFSDSYFADLRSALTDHLHLADVWSPEGDLACGSGENQGYAKSLT